MKCPHCDYVNGWSPDNLDEVYGDEGAFYTLPIELKRNEQYEHGTVELFACPKCKKTFID